jgi:hypothetical protein
MQAKQKVTLYLSPELHRQLKIRAAVDSEPMSELAERAIVFYLANPELVEEAEVSYGRTHRVYTCPSCDTSVVMRDGELMHQSGQSVVAIREDIPPEQAQQVEAEGEQLVTCG